jgi:hypothetical protein
MASILKQYIEEARRHEEIRKGNVSPENIEKMKKSGAIKSEEDYLKGYDKGTDNIIKKHGAKINHFSDLKNQLIGSHYNKKDNTINLPDTNKTTIQSIGVGGKKKLKDREHVIKRHEAYELSSSKKHPKSHLRITRAGSSGDHNSADVLRNEKRDTDYTTNAYGRDKGIVRMRKKSGEYRFIDELSTRKRRKINKKALEFDRTTYGDAIKDKAKKALAITGVVGAKKLYDKIKNRKKKTFIDKFKTKAKKYIKTVKKKLK